MKMMFILGTRPEIIKLSPLIQYCVSNKLNYSILHTNQHYTKELDSKFFKELELPRPNFNLNTGSGMHGQQTGKMIEKIEEILLKEMPNLIIIQGDTNTVMAGALAASKINDIKIAHVEAGLRSYDRTMPEEVNRIVTDHLSDFLFCPTKKQRDILLKEGINKKRIHVTGNTIVDVIRKNQKLSLKKSDILEKLNIKKKEYFLLTLHRPNNVDSKKNLQDIFHTLELLYKNHNLKIIFPIHPRTKNSIKKLKITIPIGIMVINPVGYLDMISLISNAQIILTDSGGIQEESCVLQVPCITLRENTERPETIEVGASKLTGRDQQKIIAEVNNFTQSKGICENPFGENVTKKIFSIIQNLCH